MYFNLTVEFRLIGSVECAGIVFIAYLFPKARLADHKEKRDDIKATTRMV